MSTAGQIKNLLCASLLAATVASPAFAAPIVYMTGTGNPWGVTSTNLGSNETAMNTAFGVGNWTKYQGFSMAGFGADTKFLYLDGSDAQANQFSSFLAANQAALTTYVTNGGTIILNSAPNQGGSFAMGFGATLNYNFGAGTVFATADGIATGIFQDIGTTFTGTSFSHSHVTGGAGYVSLLNDGSGRSAFGVKRVGEGMVGFGGMTLPYFHSPAANGRQLLANMFTYVAGEAHEVPEPGSVLLIGLGLAGVAFARRRKA